MGGADTKEPSIGRSDTRSAITRGDTAGQRRSTGARAEARECAAGQGDALREGNHHTRRVLSVIHHAQAGGQQVWEMARTAV